MTNIVVLSKENLATLQNLQGSQHAILNQAQAAVVQVGYSKDDIASIERSGTSAIIRLKNGEKIVIENFFDHDGSTENELVFPNRDGGFDVVEFDEKGNFINYNPITKLTELASSDLWVQTNPTTVEMSAAVAASPWYEKAWVKPALVFLGLEALYLTAFDNHSSSSNKRKDITPPAIPTAELDEAGTTIKGVTEANAKVYVVDEAGKVLAQTQADSLGQYTVTLSQALTDGARVGVYAKDAAGNSSQAKIIEGTKDTIAPDAANAQINDQGHIITGKAEAGAKVYVYAADGTTLIGGPITVAKDGSFSVLLKDHLEMGSQAILIVEDAAGNRSSSSQVIVGQDTLAPDPAKVEVNAEGNRVTGLGEVGAVVEVRNAAQELIATTTIDADGKFELSLNPAVTADQVLELTLTDAAGNQSQAVELKPKLDSIVPDAAVASINAEGNIITGTAEPNSTIEVYNASSTLLAKVTTDSNGDFSVTLSNPLMNKTVGYIYVLDAANNRSEATQVVGLKDTIAPNRVTLQTATDDVGDEMGVFANNASTDDTRPTFKGIGEANATLIIYDHGIAIGSLTVANNNTWTYTPDFDLSLGAHRFSFSQTDASGNISEMSASFNFTVVPLVTPETADTVNLTAMTTLETLPMTVLGATSVQFDESGAADLEISLAELLPEVFATESVLVEPRHVQSGLEFVATPTAIDAPLWEQDFLTV